MNLHDVHRGIQKNKPRKRLGRGPGSGHGKTSGRGYNGQGSRRGTSTKPTFEGGKMPVVRRVPKRGFNNRWAKEVVTVNVGELDEVFAAGDEITVESLREKGFAKGRHDVLKILGDGDLSKKLTIAAHRFSETAKEKIEKAGGTMVVLPGPAPVVKNKMRKKK